MEYLIIDNENRTIIIKKSCPIDIVFFAIDTFKGTDAKIILEDKGITFKI